METARHPQTLLCHEMYGTPLTAEHGAPRGCKTMMRSIHPYLVRLTHWIAAITIFVLILSGLDIFRTFPSFGSKFAAAGMMYALELARAAYLAMLAVGPPRFFQAWRWPKRASKPAGYIAWRLARGASG